MQVGVPALGIYLFGFAVTIAVSERKGMAESLSKSVRAARLPGSNNLLFALLYVFVSLAIQVILTTSYGGFDVNPAVKAWAWVLLANLFHVCIYAALSFRYLYFADSVRDAPARRLRGGGSGQKAKSVRPGTAKTQVKSTTPKKNSAKSGSSKSNKNRRR